MLYSESAKIYAFLKETLIFISFEMVYILYWKEYANCKLHNTINR
jgi:hypothetical protein